MTDQVSVVTNIERFLNTVWVNGDVRELRSPKYNKYGHTLSGYFDDPATLAKAAIKYDGKANLYITLNPVNPALLARANNHIKERAEHTTSDSDILQRRWFYLDIDPVRPSGISSTETERESALAVLKTVTGFLSDCSWPDPVTAMSGNGYYALYHLELANTPVITTLLRSVLETLASRFNTETAHVDVSVYNPSRLVALIGSMKCKGDYLTDRPHRRSCLVSVPKMISELRMDLLAALSRLDTKLETRCQSSAHMKENMSVRKALDKSDIDYREQPPDAQGFTWYHVRRCPFHADGRDFECGVGQKLPDGLYTGHCFHPEGAGKGWQEWKQALRLYPGNNQSVTPLSSTPVASSQENLRLTDTWNAHRLVSENQDDILWCEVFKQWYVFDGTRYARDLTREIERRAEHTVKSLYEHAGGLSSGDERRRLAEWAISSESRHRLTNMIESAKRMVPVDPTQFDQEQMLFNVSNGTIDLRTQELRSHERQDRISKTSAVTYDAEATCPLWTAFLNRIFAENQTLIRFFQRLFGYCLTGLTTEQIIVIMYGTGSNGKSTALHILRALAGDYAHHSRPEVFTTKRNDSQGFELVPLAGARIVTATETSAGRRLDEALIKEMTGGEPITCAPKYGSFFSFQPQFKPLLATNNKPEIRGADEGIWRRVRLIPFTVTIPEKERDKRLPQKLEGELSGILNWALAGVKDFLESGLQTPDEVRSATELYRAEQDILGSWIEERCNLGAELVDEYAGLYQDYSAWCEKNNDEAINKVRFSSSLDERGCTADRGTKGKRMRHGIARRVTG